MLTVEEESSHHTVIVTVDGPPGVIDELEDHARSGLEMFTQFAGFVAGALHRSADRARLVQYLQWTDESSYLSCRDDPRWDEMSSAQRFKAHVDGDRVTVDERSYEIRRVVSR